MVSCFAFQQNRKEGWKLTAHCPFCSSQLFWTRPMKRSFESVGALQVMCHRCSHIYWVVRSRGESGFFTRTYRNQEGGLYSGK